MHARSRRRVSALAAAAAAMALGGTVLSAPSIGAAPAILPASDPAIATSWAARPVGEAPCAEGQSRTRTLYTLSFETGIPESRFAVGTTRSTASGAVHGSYAGRLARAGSGGPAYFHLPYVSGSVGENTRLAFAHRGNAASARNVVAVNSFGSSFATSNTWRGTAFDITAATRDEAGWLGGWFQHNVTTGASTYLAIDNLQMFACRTNATTRIAGNNRYATAALLSERFAPGVPAVFIARGDNFPDALSASALGAYRNSPVLLTATSALPRETTQALSRLRPNEIIVLGNEGSVNATVAEELARYAPVRRLGGSNRYATSALIAGQFPPQVPVVFLSTGLDFADAMTGGALAGHRDGPLLLTDPAALPPAVKDELTRLQPAEIVILGSHPTVTNAVEIEAAAYAPRVRRIAGPNRYATAALIAAEFPTSVPHTYLATGLNFPDGLTAGAVAGSQGVPLLISATGGMHPSVTERLTTIRERAGFVIGHQDALSSLVRDQYGRTLP
ncbi:MAG: cell wall-binding repeat-containing protein [Actinomycetia bacterium]|nr:cell wall-binding repeat-containing protein [Actinomycetes bacterium]